MEKSLTFLHKIHREHTGIIKRRAAYLGENLYYFTESWNYYFQQDHVNNRDRYLEVLRIGMFNILFTLNDVLRYWSGDRRYFAKTVERQEGGKWHLICLLRNYLTHAGEFFPMSVHAASNGNLDFFAFVSLEDFDIFDKNNFCNWKENFLSQQYQDFLDENEKDELINDFLRFRQSDIYVLDSEVCSSIQLYFNTLIKL